MQKSSIQTRSSSNAADKNALPTNKKIIMGYYTISGLDYLLTWTWTDDNEGVDFVGGYRKRVDFLVHPMLFAREEKSAIRKPVGQMLLSANYAPAM